MPSDFQPLTNTAHTPRPPDVSLVLVFVTPDDVRNISSAFSSGCCRFLTASRPREDKSYLKELEFLKVSLDTSLPHLPLRSPRNRLLFENVPAYPSLSVLTDGQPQSRFTPPTVH